MFNVDVIDPSSVKWYLSHDVVIPVNQSVDFVLKGELMEGSMVHVEYTGPQYIKRLVEATDNRWSQEFTEAGLYQTFVTMATGNAGSNTIESLLLVQENITGLQLTGPQRIKLEALAKDYFWEAIIRSGTDVMYLWSLLPLSEEPNITGVPYGVLDKHRRHFQDPGIYNLVVSARNNVSQAEANLLIIVSHPVSKVTVQTRPIPLGSTSNITITAIGADNVSVQVDFGDNSSTEVVLQSNSNVSTYNETILHRYTSKGTYIIRVNVSNQVSFLEETGVVLVGEPITGIKLHTTSPAIVQVAEWVVVTATVATGDDLTFEWDFSDEVYQTSQYLKVISEGNTSTANYSFSMAGQYAVSVRVYNILYTEPFTETLNFNFHVMEVVSQLTIEIYKKITGLPLQGSAPNLSTPVVYFQSKCTGSDVTFEFNFGDGITKQVPGKLLQYVEIMMAESSHRYTKEGVYNVSVTARNSLSEMTSYLAMPFYVQLPPQGLQLHPEMIRTPFGPLVTHEYTQVGRYKVTVIAKNDVSQLTKTAEVEVLHRLQRVNLVLTKTVVATYEVLLYRAETFPENADVSYFEWNFGVQGEPKQSYDPFKTHMYTIPSRYTVTVSAHNSLSHVESEPMVVFVQSPVSENLEIRYDPKKRHHIVDEESSFSVYHFSGNDLFYTWDFGDGTENKTTQSKTMSHIYTSVGEYVIRVWAKNMLSMTSASDNIFVLRKKCVKPELVIRGEFTKGESVSIHVNRSKELYVEVELKNVDCDITNATAYRWTFYNASSGREVELNTLDDDVLRKKILRIPARVLPYGTYDLKVTVMVRGTIVHSECQTKVSVDPTPLRCSIKGGLYREVRRDSLIVLDGANSLDPDTNSQSSLRFNWTCYVDYDKGKPCFKENFTDTVTMDTVRISFPGGLLKENKMEFMMTLTLMAENRDHVECSQMIHVSRILELSIYCPQCEQSLVNWDWPLSFQAVCTSCDPIDLEYEWTMYMVPDLGQSDVNHRYDKFSRSCAIAGQTHISKLVHTNKTVLINVDPSHFNARVIPADTQYTRTEEVNQRKTSTTTPQSVGLFYPIEDHGEGRSRAKEFSSITFQESRLISGRKRGSDNVQNILDTADIPQKDGSHARLNKAQVPPIERSLDTDDIPYEESRQNTLDIADIPQMDNVQNTLDSADIPKTDHGQNTLNIGDIPRTDNGRNTLNIGDIPRMDIPRIDNGRNTLNIGDIPQMDNGHNTLNTGDIPQMDNPRNTLNTEDIPQMNNGHNTLNTGDFPQMDNGRNTLNTEDIPQMNNGRNTLNTEDIPQMNNGRNTLNTEDIPQMNNGRNTLNTGDIPRMDNQHNTLNTEDIPRMDNPHNSLNIGDIPQMNNGRNTLNTEDIPRMDNQHNTLNTEDIPRMNNGRNTLNTEDIPQMNNGRNTLNTEDIPRMDNPHNTLNTEDIPRMNNGRNTLNTEDIPRMNNPHNTLNTEDIPRMDNPHNTLNTEDIPRMNNGRNTLNTEDIPRMNNGHNTFNTEDIPQMDNPHNTLNTEDIPRMDNPHNTLNTEDIPRMNNGRNTLNTGDIPQMDNGRNTLNTGDIPQMNNGRNTLNTGDIPQMNNGRNTLNTGDIPRMNNGRNTLNIGDIPQMDNPRNTLNTGDIPQMNNGRNTLNTGDIPQMNNRHNTLNTGDIPRMNNGRNTLNTGDIPQMNNGRNTLNTGDIPQMDNGRNTLNTGDIPQMDNGRNTLNTGDIPQMDNRHNTLNTEDIPGRDSSPVTQNSADVPNMESGHETLDTADISHIDESHFNIYNPIIEENTRVESSRRKPNPHTDMFEVKEGSPGEEGSSIARNPAYDNDIFEEISSGNRQKPAVDDNENSSENGNHPVISDTFGPSEPARQKHILQHAHYPMVLVWSATLTGLNKRSLVLKPNNEAIQQGSTYIMHVKATSKDGLAKGHAMAQFKVNQSPHQGDCSVKPDSGFEMSTEFTIFCREWRDVEEHLPLWYEVSYNLEETDVRYVIYRGLQSSINFILPAGNPNNNHRVFVYITILDSLSGRTPVCHAPLTVRPQPPEQFEVTFEAIPSPEEIIFYEAFNGNGSIVKAQEQGYEHRVKVLVRYLATRLNQLPQYGSEVNEQRQEIRHKLLGILKHLPMRDELEVIQTLQALAALTEVASELNQAELDLASAVFRSILDRASELYGEALTPTHELLTLAVTTASNVISATVRSAARDEADQRWFYHTSMSTSIHTLDQLLKNELKFHAIGQEPIKKHAHYVETMAARFSLKDRPVLAINQSKFSLPKDMSVIMKKDNCPLDTFSPNHDCFQVHMTKFLGNPYEFDHNKNTKVVSEVGALKIYTCDGESVEVSGLQDDNMVTMEIPRLPLKEETTLSELIVQHRLERTLMNLHQFNVSREHQHQSLNIIFTLTPAFEDRLFPIALMIGFQGPPTPDNYLLRREFDVTSLQAKLFLPAGYFNVTGSYYLGVVDGGYNSGRHRQGEATQRNYTLKIWWANCLYWNDSESEWSDDGCWSTGESTFYVTHCRCNHLTAFGSHFDLVPNELSFIAVEDFFSHHENLTTVTLLVIILCLYAILMVICHRADIHDAKKGGITYLQDNTITDQQRFEVTVETGFRKGAGTTAKISLILHGEEGMSETRELITDDPRPLFERNSRDKFILTLPDSIGKIWKVQIWHNNSGQSPSWYLSRVIVKDLNNGNIYYFLSEKWLAVEEEDGKVEREFMALEGSLGVRRVFWAKGTQYMADYHLWTSLFTHPSPSQFTRTQRLTCCLTLLMMYMCLNAVWYKQTPSEVRGEFGLLDLSLRNVTIGAICCAVTIPVNLFLAMLFRRSKKQKSTGEVDPELEEEKDKHYSSGKPDGVPQDDDEDSEAVQPVMTYSILDQSILNWPSIQDWAQKQWMKRQHSSMSIEETTSGKTNDNTLQQRQTTLTPTHILHKRVIGSETDQASSGFEDSNSTDPRPQMTISSQASSIKNKAPSVSSSVSQKSSVLSARKTFEQRWFLPYWFQYVAWTLCAIICLGCAVITVLYGFRFGHTKGMMWLQSLYFSAIVCIFISHPLMICIAVVYTAIKYRNNPSILDHYEDGAFGEQAKLEILRRKKEKAKETLDEHKEIERGVAARQRSRYLRFARPPQEKQLIEARKKILQEKKAMSLISNSAGFCVMFILLCVMAFGKDIITSPFYLNQAIKDLLIRSGPVKFADISRPGDWYKWSQATMLDTLYTDYSHYNNNSKVVQNFALHGSSFVIGQIHLRQLKVVEEPCAQKLPHLPEYCLYDYAYTNKMSDISPDMNETWTEKTSLFKIFGQHGIYDNSGYVIKLDNSRSKALSQLHDLEYRGWINRHTRVVIVEFTLFNAPTNLFSSVTLFMELPPTGGAFPDHRVVSTYLYRYMSAGDNFVMACELFFVILTLYKLKKEVCDMIKLKRNYLHSAWNIVQCLMVGLSLTFIACYLYRFMLVWEALENMRSTYFEQFVDVSLLAVWDEILRVLVGIILFLVFIKSLRLLRYNKLFALFGNVYRRVHKEIIIFTALFVGLLMAFSSLGLLLFGSFCWSFHDYWTTLFTMMSLMAGHYQHPNTEHTMSYFLRVFVFCFCVFFTGFLTSYVIAFLAFRFRIYRRKQGDILAMNGRDALLFYWKQFLLWTGIRYEPPVHEPENVLPAEFTMVEIEYQVDELYFRINALSGLHSLPEKPTGYLTDSDGTYGVGDDGISSGGSEIQQGEEERLDQRVQQIEDYLYSQEPYLAQLLKTDNTDPDLLSQEKEKQLKSHLEMEIFRQLQIQRRDTDQPTSSAVKAGSSQSKKVETDGAKGGAKDNGPEDQKKSVYSYAPPEESNSNESCDLDTQTSTSSNPESPREHDKNSTKATIEKQVRVSVCQTDKTGSQSSDSDKGLFTKGLKNEVKQKKPEPPPKPTFINHSLRDAVSHDASRPGVMGSPALRQLRSSLNTIERLSFKGDNSGSSFTTESSSGSEQDAIHGMQRPLGKQRNLRKTKSRGKGKGSVNLTGSLLDELDTEDKEELEQYEFEIQNTEDQVEQESSQDQSGSANKTPSNKEPNDKEPITKQETSDNKEDTVRCSVKDSIKAFEKRAVNSS
ncbi:polycystic kidney disease protein 1-like 1 [Pecten maximus]|uniref:polycystic kidney disease protein 1-like 1 n=1 Tax=Pecten maximus TaxID=6579 RepID=UPI0014583109|nr:polycystic kidney disease protein 1-like 1 [Pecten maximus]